MSKTEKAEWAVTEVALRVSLRVDADGTVHISNVVHHTDPPRLVRGWTSAEMRDYKLDSPTEEGGCAILSPEHVKNGAALVADTRRAAEGLVDKLRRAAR